MNASAAEPFSSIGVVTAREIVVALFGVTGVVRATVEEAIANERDMRATRDLHHADIAITHVDALGELRQCAPGVHVVALASLRDDDGAADALRSGAHAVLSDRDGTIEIVAALRAVSAGGVWISPKLLRRLLDDAPPVRRAANESVPILSPRERDVLGLLAHGATQPQIASLLFISPHTVRTHVRNLMRKLGTHTCAEAVARAFDNGLID
jgi:DNA-binding NarL/FixJ family response regulator